MRQSCLHYPLVLRTLCVSRAAMVHVAPGSRSPFWSQNQVKVLIDTTPSVQTGSSHPTRKSSSAVQSSCVCVSQVLKAALKAARGRGGERRGGRGEGAGKASEEGERGGEARRASERRGKASEARQGERGEAQGERGEARRERRGEHRGEASKARRGERADSRRWRSRRGDGERGDAMESEAVRARGDAMRCCDARRGAR